MMIIIIFAVFAITFEQVKQKSIDIEKIRNEIKNMPEYRVIENNPLNHPTTDQNTIFFENMEYLNTEMYPKLIRLHQEIMQLHSELKCPNLLSNEELNKSREIYGLLKLMYNEINTLWNARYRNEARLLDQNGYKLAINGQRTALEERKNLKVELYQRYLRNCKAYLKAQKRHGGFHGGGSADLLKFERVILVELSDIPSEVPIEFPEVPIEFPEVPTGVLQFTPVPQHHPVPNRRVKLPNRR
eukprot:NODE_281_length_10828_cov_0.749837.p6 type:complete len:243 gc:universal NODE_281_length_10828_cov_0.749837:5607-4879(-)